MVYVLYININCKLCVYQLPIKNIFFLKLSMYHKKKKITWPYCATFLWEMPTQFNQAHIVQLFTKFEKVSFLECEV